MKCFYFHRLVAGGKLESGFEKLSFTQAESARYYLEQQKDCVIVRLWMLPGWVGSFYDMFKRVFRSPMSMDEMADFFHNLAVMQRSGIPMFEAMEELSGDESSASARKLALHILDSLRSGASLSSSLQRHSDTVPHTVLHLVSIGESSGTLDRTLMDAADHLRRVGKISQDAKRAMIYPLFVFLSILAATLFWIVYVIPGLSDLFRQMGVDMPPLTTALLAFSDMIAANLTWILLAAAISSYVAYVLVRNWQPARLWFHSLLLRLPVSRVLVRSSSMAFITEYLSLLVGAGISILNSVKVLEDATSNEVYRRALQQVRVGMMRGNSLSHEMRQTGRFPGFAVRMISVGEQTGGLDVQLRYLADDYRRRFDHVVASIAEIVKPVVMLLAGGLFVIMIMALFLPIYELIRHMSNQGF
ncbi:type II secretion system F family protein [Pseudohongiella sp. SYSU M77423]|uniref:type II secretion system F family protein n=1 Tax=Pseudohongiella sp. SYSU M77423 TaxID=3042312 RepID=UPI002480A5C1|nr:type II secretion system F family protein [Pseudohongiella sp. SYSU M77423]MDH7942550.1 type II secretion system F family protein [Pseudohongiella sp. SYSU M77423]